MIRQLVHDLGGPRKVAAQMQSVREVDDGTPNENQISKWIERDRVPFVWRKHLRAVAVQAERALSEAEDKALEV